jgi:hypothetical protein
VCNFKPVKQCTEEATQNTHNVEEQEVMVERKELYNGWSWPGDKEKGF